MKTIIVGIFATLFGLAVGITATQVVLGNSTEIQAVLLTGFAAIAVSVVATGATLWTIIDNAINGRIKATLDHLALKEGDSDFEHARRIFIRLSNDAAPLEKWAKLNRQAEQESSAVRAYLNTFEFQAIALKAGAFDHKVYAEWQRGTVLSVWKAASVYVANLRTYTGRPSLYENLEALAKKYGA